MNEKVSREKKHKTIIYIIACLSGLSMGVAIALASSGYIGLPSSNPYFPIGSHVGLSEELEYTDFAWGPGNAYCNVTVRNAGSTDVIIVQVEINNIAEMNNFAVAPDTPVLPYTLTKEGSVTIKVTSTFNSGMQYCFRVVTHRGAQFGSLSQTAP